MADGPHPSFDRTALEATLADAMKMADTEPVPSEAPAASTPPPPVTAASFRPSSPPSRLAAPNVSSLIGRPEASKLTPPRLGAPASPGLAPGSLGGSLRVPGGTGTSSGFGADPEPPAEQATITLPKRRPQPVRESAAGHDHEGGVAASARDGAAEKPRFSSIEPWSPRDDDILPPATARRRRLRRS